MSQKYTPGPYRVDPRAKTRVVAGENTTMATTACDSDQSDAWEGNAAQIAAALNMFWRPLETAPTTTLDEEPIPVLLWVVGGGNDGKGCSALGFCYRSVSGEVRASSSGYRGFQVTHWMPEPAGPVT